MAPFSTGFVRSRPGWHRPRHLNSDVMRSHQMTYNQFLEKLREGEWVVPNRSFAHKLFGAWQVSFIRIGGRFQQPGMVAFVVCVRHASLRSLAGELVEVPKEPHSYPFKFTFAEIEEGNFQYQSKLLNYEISDLPVDADWSGVSHGMQSAIPAWLSSFTADALVKQIKKHGSSGYIERIWIEDLD